MQKTRQQLLTTDINKNGHKLNIQKLEVSNHSPKIQIQDMFSTLANKRELHRCNFLIDFNLKCGLIVDRKSFRVGITQRAAVYLSHDKTVKKILEKISLLSSTFKMRRSVQITIYTNQFTQQILKKMTLYITWRSLITCQDSIGSQQLCQVSCKTTQIGLPLPYYPLSSLLNVAGTSTVIPFKKRC